MKKVILLLLISFPLYSRDINHLSLPKGFFIEIYADGLKQPRSLTVTKGDTVFVGSKYGDVYQITPDREVQLIDRDLNLPVGIDYYMGDLYVAELDTLRVYRDVLENPKMEILNSDLPGEGWHGFKYIRVGSDKKIYMNIGAPCNICETREFFGSIVKMDLNGDNWEFYARGVRNSVGFDWSPVDGQFWFTDNGADGMGDDYPPDELNRVTYKGEHFGFPYTYKDGPSELYTEPEWFLPAHVAALGMRFYTGNMFPDKYHNGVFIAEHGSWNRSEKIGYRVSYITIESNQTKGYEVFLDGWEINEQVSGRPADLDFLSDGSMLISDDYAGKVYRVYYRP